MNITHAYARKLAKRKIAQVVKSISVDDLMNDGYGIVDSERIKAQIDYFYSQIEKRYKMDEGD